MKQSVVRSSPIRHTRNLHTTVLSRALLVACAGLSLPALATDECGAPVPGGQVVCAPKGADDPPVPRLHYFRVSDFELLLKSGFSVDGSLSKDGETAVIVYGEGAVTLTAEDGTVIRCTRRLAGRRRRVVSPVR